MEEDNSYIVLCPIPLHLRSLKLYTKEVLSFPQSIAKLFIFVTGIDIVILGCCTRFQCTLIKWYLKLAKIFWLGVPTTLRHSLLFSWMNELTNKSILETYIHVYCIHSYIVDIFKIPVEPFWFAILMQQNKNIHNIFGM